MNKKEDPIKYFSLDEAREELKKRWNNIGLREAVEKELEGNFLPFFNNGFVSVVWKSMLTPDRGFDFYYNASKYVGCEVTPIEYLGDKFVTINADKKALSRLHLYDKLNNKISAEIVEYMGQEGKRLDEIKIKDGSLLKDFHKNIYDKFYPDVITRDITDWCIKNGGAVNYYYPYFLHFICHGILFESFATDSSREDLFTENILIPNLQKIMSKFNLFPLVVRLYPLEQTEDEDYYWFSYNPVINDFLLEYSIKNNLIIKK